MTSADVARIAGILMRRLDAVHPGMLPVVVVLLVAISVTAVPLTAFGGVLAILRRGLVAATNYQGRRARTGVAP